MAISRPCPKCQQPLSIPEPIPEKLQCSKCGTVIKFKSAAAATAPVKAPLPPPPKPAPEPIEPLVFTNEAPAVKKDPLVEKEPARATGILSYLHTVIPKPVLFGSYGALGGLLGVLLLGELFWFLLNPTPQELKPLVVAVSSELKLFPGSRNTLKIKIARYGFMGPVRLEPIDLPLELQLPEITIPAGETDAEIPIGASPKAAEGVHNINLRALSVDNANIKVNETIQIWIQPTPASLGLTVSPIVTVYAAGQNRFGFMVARQRFEGPVRVEVLDLPKGVHIPLLTLQEKEEKGELTVAVDKDAKLGAHVILLADVHSLADHRIFARKEFQLNILPPPGKLQLAASGQVTVFPGTKNKFTVKIARQEFKGAIQIDVTGGPRGVTFSRDVVIPEDKSEADIEVTAAKEMTAGLPPEKNLRVNAKAINPENTLTKMPITEEIATFVPLQLNIDLPPHSVQLAVSPKVPVYPGGSAKFGVKINRERFKGPVQLIAQPANPGLVNIAPLVIPADKNEGEMLVSVNSAALSGLSLKQIMPATVTARKADGTGIPGTDKVDVEILAPPSELGLTVSPEVEVYQAGKCSFTIKIARGGFVGPVQINFNNVPAGVTLPAGVIGANDFVFRGNALIDVAPKKYEIEVTGTGPKAPDGKVPTKTEKFSLIVKKFDPSMKPPLDIVFVLDVTQSLDPQIAGLKNGIGRFVQGLKERELEARIGLIGFRDITVPDEVHFEYLKFKGELFTTDTNAFSVEVGKLKASGGGDDPESSLDAMVKAANYPFRPKALRVLFLITDEKPQTKGNSVTMAIAQQALRDKKIDQVHLIVKKADMPIYAGLQQSAKGGVFDFHEASKTVEGFAGILPLLSKEIATTIGAPEPPMSKVPTVPEAAALPAAPAGEKTPEPRAEASPSSPTPAVPQPPTAGAASIIKAAEPNPPVADEIAPPVAVPPSIQGVQSTAVYAEKDRTQLMIAFALWAAALAGGIALTLVVAQKRYLRQAWPSIGEAIKALFAGSFAGLFAGIAVQWLFALSTSGSAWTIAISRVVAWVVLGGLIGGAMSFFVPNMKWRRAVLGGCLGGLIGALGFALVSMYADSFLGRLIGAALLGLFIGLMVALAEMASRRYWLEVAFGEREIRTVTLGTATVAVGGDEKLVGVYVPNAPARAFGFRVDKNRVFCEEFATGRTTEAAPGDQRSLANAKIRVCCATEAQPTGANLQLVVVRDVPLMVGMPLTADDIPGLEPQGSDGIVALVSRRPNNPKIYLLRNRSKQPWTITEADGKVRKVDPGLSIELSAKCEIDFGQVKGMLDPSS